MKMDCSWLFGRRGDIGSGVRVGNQCVPHDYMHVAVAGKERIQVRSGSFPQPTKHRAHALWEFHPEFCQNWLPVVRGGNWASTGKEIYLSDSVIRRRSGVMGAPRAWSRRWEWHGGWRLGGTGGWRWEGKGGAPFPRARGHRTRCSKGGSCRGRATRRTTGGSCLCREELVREDCVVCHRGWLEAAR